MAYTTEANIRARSPFKDPSKISLEYVVLEIGKVEDYLDAKLGVKYSLPLKTVDDIEYVPPVIKLLAEMMVIENIRLQQATNQEVQDNATRNLEYANQTLEEIKDGEVILWDNESPKRQLQLASANSGPLPDAYPNAAAIASGEYSTPIIDNFKY